LTAETFSGLYKSVIITSLVLAAGVLADVVKRVALSLGEGGTSCAASSEGLGFRTCWSSEDWPTVTKGISDIGPWMLFELWSLEWFLPPH